MNEETTVFAVDDDPTVLKSLSWLLESVGLRVVASSDPVDFLKQYDPLCPGCIILDMRMPRLSGLEVQERLLELGCRHPIIFVTGHGDVPSCSRAFKSGAFDFLEKPVNDHRLLEMTWRAIEEDAKRRSKEDAAGAMGEKRARLTSRELEVLDLLVDGKTNKQIAAGLQITFPTAARHRARILEKMEVANEVELVRQLLAAEACAAPE